MPPHHHRVLVGLSGATSDVELQELGGPSAHRHVLLRDSGNDDSHDDGEDNDDVDVDDAQRERARASRRASCAAQCVSMLACVGAFLTFCFSAASMTMLARQSTCWTARDELEMLSRFELQGAGELGAVPLPHAHSHNDYEQPKPLAEALQAGFCSVEADVYLKNGALLLGHMVPEDMSIEDEYIRPLAARVVLNGGFVYRRALRLGVCAQFTLLVDFKAVEGKKPTFFALEALVRKYDKLLPDGRSIFEAYNAEDGSVVTRDSSNFPSPIRIVCTGLKDETQDIGDLLLTAPAGLGGGEGGSVVDPTKRKFRIDLSGETASEALLKVGGWISQKWDFPWPSNPEAKNATRLLVRSRVRYAHKHNLVVRYWDSPEDPQVWQLLLEEGVDLINTDRIYTLHSFLSGRRISGDDEDGRGSIGGER